MEGFSEVPQELNNGQRRVRIEELRQTIARLNELISGQPARYGSPDDLREYEADLEKFTAELEREETLLAQERAA